MVHIRKFDTSGILTLSSNQGRLIYDDTLNVLKYNNSVDYTSILLFKDENNDLTNLNNVTLSGNLNITNHDRTENTGLTLNSVLVTATAEEINYNSEVIPGIASASKTVILDEDKNITGINILGAASMEIGSITSTGNLGINTNTLTYGLNVNEATGKCVNLIYNDTNSCKLEVESNGSLKIVPSGSNPGVTINGFVNTANAITVNKIGSLNNAVDYPLSMVVYPPGTAENGLGCGIEFQTLNDNNDIVPAGLMDAYMIDVTNNSESSGFRWTVQDAGAWYEAATLNNKGKFSCETIESTDLSESSDRRIKNNIEDLSVVESFNNITKLNPKSYTIKDDKKTKHGLIAQELKEVIPELVNISESNKYDIEDFHSIRYTELIPHLINCIKYLKMEISALKMSM